MEKKTDVNVPLLITLAIGGGLLLITIIIGVQAWNSYVSEETYAAESKTAVVEPLAEMKKRQLSRLSQRATDPRTHTRSISIDEAIDRYVEMGGKMPPMTRPTTQPAGGG